MLTALAQLIDRWRDARFERRRWLFDLTPPESLASKWLREDLKHFDARVEGRIVRFWA